MARWSWVVVVLGGGYAATTLFLDDNPVLGGLVAAGSLLYAYWVGPLRGGRSVRHEDVMALPEEQRPVVVYWRPGCAFCARLRSALGDQADVARWVNIWQDRDAAAFVRSVNQGDEIVPTVVIDGAPHTNPETGVVRQRLEQLT